MKNIMVIVMLAVLAMFVIRSMLQVRKASARIKAEPDPMRVAIM